MKLSALLVSAFFLCGLLVTGCDEKSGCNDCGGTLVEGYIFTTVTSGTISDYVEDMPDIEINACVRYKLISDEKEDITLVDDCCCNSIE